MPRNFSFTVADVLDDTATFDPAALAAVRAFARAKPWVGTDAERLAKFQQCADALTTAYRLPAWTFQLGPMPAVNRRSRTIVLTRLSVVTFLHAMARARGMTTFAACRWSINLFRRCFPRSYASLVPVGPFLITRDRAAQLVVNLEGSN